MVNELNFGRNCKALYFHSVCNLIINEIIYNTLRIIIIHPFLLALSLLKATTEIAFFF